MKRLKKYVCAFAAVIAAFSVEMSAYAAPEVMPDGSIFDAEYYAQNNPDVVAAFGTDPGLLYQHYRLCGKNELRLPYDPAADLSNVLTIGEESVRGFYGNSVFIGDSIMIGFRRYSVYPTAVTHEAQFLCSGSYSAAHALAEEDDLHPLYRGEARPVWESISLMETGDVFILFGTNEIGIFKPDVTAMHIELLADKILEVNPEVHIHLISMTPIYRGVTKLNSENVDLLNGYLQEMTERRNWGYVNIHDPLCDGNGRLRDVYCSDSYVHQTMRAYSEVWDSVLGDYAEGVLKERVLQQLGKNN